MDKETLIDILEITIFIGLVYIMTIIVFANIVIKLIQHGIPVSEILYFVLLSLYGILFNVCWGDSNG